MSKEFKLSPVVTAAGMMHPQLPDCDPNEVSVCDACLGAADMMLNELVPDVLGKMGVSAEDVQAALAEELA